MENIAKSEVLSDVWERIDNSVVEIVTLLSDLKGTNKSVDPEDLVRDLNGELRILGDEYIIDLLNLLDEDENPALNSIVNRYKLLRKKVLAQSKKITKNYMKGGQMGREIAEELYDEMDFIAKCVEDGELRLDAIYVNLANKHVIPLIQKIKDGNTLNEDDMRSLKFIRERIAEAKEICGTSV
jgi:hypothetical protein